MTWLPLPNASYTVEGYLPFTLEALQQYAEQRLVGRPFTATGCGAADGEGVVTAATVDSDLTLTLEVTMADGTTGQVKVNS